jgi:RNA polymerase sigma-70 factor (ECF subfamily)
VPLEPILPRVALGDSTAVRACLERHGALVWALARRLSPTQADAEDAVQEIFVDVWKSAARYEPAVGSEPAFIAMIARRRLIDRLRARERRPATDPVSEPRMPLPNEGGAPHAETCAEASRAADAISELRPEPRQVLMLAIRQGLSHEEIAVAMSIPLGTVKTHARRALLHVREALADKGPRLKAVGP